MGACLFWTFFEKLQKYIAQTFELLYPKYILRINFDRKWIGLPLGRFFSQTHLVNLLPYHLK
jgi:hypothetical protein